MIMNYEEMFTNWMTMPGLIDPRKSLIGILKIILRRFSKGNWDQKGVQQKKRIAFKYFESMA